MIISHRYLYSYTRLSLIISIIYINIIISNDLSLYKDKDKDNLIMPQISVIYTRCLYNINVVNLR